MGKDNNKYVMLMTGDIILGRDSNKYFNGVKTLLEESDIVLGQLEVPYSDRKEETVELDRKLEVLRPLAKYFDALSLAGNHIYDAGEIGVEDTINWLRNNGIAYTGAGMNLKEASKPVILEKSDGTKIGYISYNCVGPEMTKASQKKAGCAYIDIITHYDLNGIANPGGPPDKIYTWPEEESFNRMKKNISQLKKKCDIVCVYLHKGIVHMPIKLADYERTLTHSAIDAGADIVTSSHSHILHGIEKYKNKTIYHGLNNFVAWVPSLSPNFHYKKSMKNKLFDAQEWAKKRSERFGFIPDPDYPTYPFHPEAIYTCVAKCIIENKEIVSTRYIPMIVNKSGITEIVTRKNGGEKVFNYMKKITKGAGLNTSFEWDGNEVVVV